MFDLPPPKIVAFVR